jgi:ABC-type polysaccharide/polyol phosphate export permease
MGVVFSSLFQVDFIKFTGFLYAGMIPWNFISNVVVQSGSAYISNEGLIKKIYVPKIIFPLSVVATVFMDAILSLGVLLFIIMIIGGSIAWTILFVPIALMILLVFGIGISLIVSISTVFYRDLQYILVIGMQGLFYLTPVIYIKDTLPDALAFLISLNPITSLIEIFRMPLSPRVLPTLSLVTIAILSALSTLALGVFIFLRQEKKIIFRL